MDSGEDSTPRRGDWNLDVPSAPGGASARHDQAKALLDQGREGGLATCRFSACLLQQTVGQSDRGSHVFRILAVCLYVNSLLRYPRSGCIARRASF